MENHNFLPNLLDHFSLRPDSIILFLNLQYPINLVCISCCWFLCVLVPADIHLVVLNLLKYALIVLAYLRWLVVAFFLDGLLGEAKLLLAFWSVWLLQGWEQLEGVVFLPDVDLYVLYLLWLLCFQIDLAHEPG